MIAWEKLARPLPNLYDAAVILAFASAEQSPRCGRRYTRRTPASGERTFFGGEISVRHLSTVCNLPSLPFAENGPLDAPQIDTAESLIRNWPEGYEAFAVLMDTLSPIISRGASEYSASHSEEDLFGTMYATVHDPLALAECCVHEMAHHKLRALGVGVNRARTILRNSPDELYVSPIIKDRKRPMSAVLHATYAFLHVLELLIAVATKETRPAFRTTAIARMARDGTRVEEGVQVIRESGVFDGNGVAFFSGLSEWAEVALRRSQVIAAARTPG